MAPGSPGPSPLNCSSWMGTLDKTTGLCRSGRYQGLDSSLSNPSLTCPHSLKKWLQACVPGCPGFRSPPGSCPGLFSPWCGILLSVCSPSPYRTLQAVAGRSLGPVGVSSLGCRAGGPGRLKPVDTGSHRVEGQGVCAVGALDGCLSPRGSVLTSGEAELRHHPSPPPRPRGGKGAGLSCLSAYRYGTLAPTPSCL